MKRVWFVQQVFRDQGIEIGVIHSQTSYTVRIFKEFLIPGKVNWWLSSSSD
jgi:hypothetical protein